MIFFGPSIINIFLLFYTSFKNIKKGKKGNKLMRKQFILKSNFIIMKLELEVEFVGHSIHWST